LKLIIAVLLPLSIFAGTIDFQSALDKTLQNNKSLKAKKLDIEISKEVLNEAEGYNYGSLVFSENISRTNSAAYVFGMKLSSREADFGDFGFSDFLTPMGAAISGAANGTQPPDMSSVLNVQPNDLNYPDDRTNYETKVKYELPIFTGFKLDSAQKMAKLQILAKKAKYGFDEKQLSLEVLKAYNGAVAAKEFVQATQKAKEATNAFVKLANELFKEGLVTSIDVKQARVYDIGVDAKIIESQNRFDLALAYLRFLTNDPSINGVQGFNTVSKQVLIPGELKSKALQNRDDFKWMEYNKKTMKEKINFEASEDYPKIGAMVEYGYNDNTFSVSNMDDKDYYLAAVGISYNVFDGFVTKAKKQKAKIEHKKMQHLHEYMKEGIKLEVEKNILNLKAKKKIFQQKQLTQNLADEVLQQSTQMYKNHLISMNDLLMQQANNQKAIAETIFAKYEKSLAAAALKLSLGESLRDTKE
jgi:outer membrane protein TolC